MKATPKVLDLFSGIGGFSLGLERAGMETVAFCEVDPFCQKVLRKHWPDVPIYDDVRTIDYDGSVDVVCGGFPCQPFSVAGKRRGEKDDRHLWPSMLRLIKKHRPSWVIGENVAGIINMALDDVLADLEDAGYTTQAFIIPACAVNAPHRRDRVWILGHSEHNGQPATKKQGSLAQADDDGSQGKDKDSQPARPAGTRQDVPNPNDQRRERVTQGQDEGQPPEQPVRGDTQGQGGWYLPTSRICRGNDGIPDRTHRLRALGNAVVPQIPEIIGKAIMEINSHKEGQ